MEQKKKMDDHRRGVPGDGRAQLLHPALGKGRAALVAEGSGKRLPPVVPLPHPTDPDDPHPAQRRLSHPCDPASDEGTGTQPPGKYPESGPGFPGQTERHQPLSNAGSALFVPVVLFDIELVTGKISSPRGWT